jgi:hypothetical protein
MLEDAGSPVEAGADNNVSRETSSPETQSIPGMPEDSGPIAAIDLAHPTELSLAMVEKDRAAAAATPEGTAAAEVEKMYAGKYASVEDLENGYISLQKMAGSFSGAPESYNLEGVNVEGASLHFIDDDPRMVKFKEIAKAKNMPQKTFDELLSFYRDSEIDRIAPGSKAFKAMGEAGTKMVENIKNFANMHMDETNAEIIKSIVDDKLVDKRVVMMFEAFRQASEPVEGPAEHSMQPVRSAVDTVQRLQQEIVDNYEKYTNDVGYRKALFERLGQAQAAVERG